MMYRQMIVNWRLRISKQRAQPGDARADQQSVSSVTAGVQAVDGW
jgi:hypothetical protein